MKTPVLTIVYAFIFIVLSGCASIVSKSNYNVGISSNPEGAEFSIVNKEGRTVATGKTPTSINLKAGAGFFEGEDYVVTFKKKGYATHVAQISRGVDGWYIAGNFFIGWFIGWLIVDPATGAMWTLKNLHADLNTETSSLPADNIQLMTLDQVPKHLCSEMVRIN